MSELYNNMVTYVRVALISFLLPLYILQAIVRNIFSKERCMNGKVVLITGAGNGIGAEMSHQLAALGCKVICVDINGDDAERTAKSINSKSEGSAWSDTCDVSDFKAVAKLRDRVLNRVDHVDVLINNAGILYSGTLEDGNEEVVKKLVEVNILGVAWMTRAFLPSMKKRGEGHIVLISSLSGIAYMPHIAVYGATKAALSGLGLSLKAELQSNPAWKNIEVSIAYPYFIKTNNVVESIELGFAAHSLKDGASRIISGIRHGYLEFSTLYPLEHYFFIAKFMRATPWASYGAMTNSVQAKLTSNVIADTMKHLNPTSAKN